MCGSRASGETDKSRVTHGGTHFVPEEVSKVFWGGGRERACRRHASWHGNRGAELAGTASELGRAYLLHGGPVSRWGHCLRKRGPGCGTCRDSLLQKRKAELCAARFRVFCPGRHSDCPREHIPVSLTAPGGPRVSQRREEGLEGVLSPEGQSFRNNTLGSSSIFLRSCHSGNVKIEQLHWGSRIRLQRSWWESHLGFLWGTVQSPRPGATPSLWKCRWRAGKGMPESHTGDQRQTGFLPCVRAWSRGLCPHLFLGKHPREVVGGTGPSKVCAERGGEGTP